MTSPLDFDRRSFVYRRLLDLGARFAPRAGAAVAVQPEEGGPLDRVRPVLADLSPLPRIGFKGKGTVEWLAGQGLDLPEPNRALRLAGGGLGVRLGVQEALILDADDGIAGALERAWQGEPQPPPSPRGFPAPRRDSHCWLHLKGGQVPLVFAKLCGVDLREHRFPDLAVAQTLVARLSAIVIREDQDTGPAWHLLADSAAAEYLWDCVADAMGEFEGRVVGVAAATQVSLIFCLSC